MTAALSTATRTGHTLAYVTHVTGATARQVHHWTRRGWLHADAHGSGSGHWREWPDHEVAVARLMRILTGHGIAAGEAAVYARVLADKVTAGQRPRLELGHLALELTTTQDGGAA